MRSKGQRAKAQGRWRIGALACLLLVLILPGTVAQERDLSFFRIGTGSSSGTYFPIGGVVATAISNPPGGPSCERGGSCGVPGLIAVAQATEGSVANVKAINFGRMESGFSQADVAYWALNGDEIFKEYGPFKNLRSIANLFPESLHLVVRRESGIRKLSDLKGKRISVDREGSGTQADVKLVLQTLGMSLEDFEAQYYASGVAADHLRAGDLDGFFLVAGPPATAVSELAEDGLITLVPIQGPEIDALIAERPFLRPSRIRSGTYLNVPSVATLSVGAQWLVSAEVPEDVVYDITKALFNAKNRDLLMGGHPLGRHINTREALDGLVVPLHPGARRYYSESSVPFPVGPE